MLGEFTWEDEPDGSLDFPRRERTLVAVTNKATTFLSDAVKGVVDQVVEDGNSSLADTSLGVNLLQNLGNIAVVGLVSLTVNLLASLLGGARLLANGLLSGHFNLDYFAEFFRQIILRPISIVDKSTSSHF